MKNLLTKKRISILGYFMLLVLIGSMSCQDGTLREEKTNYTRVKVNYNNLPEGLKIKDLKTSFTNVTTGEKKDLSTIDEVVEIPVGLYNIESIITTYETDPEITGIYQGRKENIEITKSDDIQTIEIDLTEPSSKGGLVIREIFLTGTKTPKGKNFSRDQYFALYNNSNKTIYADRIAILESQLISTNQWVYDPDIRNEAMTVQAFYVIPGTGKEHPIAPGETIFIAEMAQNHTLQNAYSFDLSKANFEWYDENDRYPDVDNPEVPNLDKWYCYTQSIWMLHNRGFCSYAIARIPEDMTKERYLKEYKYEYVWQINGKEIKRSGYKIPNEWILDGVNVSTPTDRVWNILPPSIDLGWTYVSEKDRDETRFFKSIRRKVDYVTANGTAIFKDDNNSTNDFNPRVIPSMIEIQGTVKDPKGNRETNKTYDGVMPIK